MCGDTVFGWPTALEMRLTSAYGEQISETVAVPANLTMMDDMVAMPTVPISQQFTVSHNPPSAEANKYYKQCIKK